MKPVALVALLLCFSSCLSHHWQSTASPHLKARAPSDYAPTAADCPSTPLVRPAKGLSDEERAYVTARKKKADAALAKWLDATCDYSDDQSKYPTLALASSGGGFRALLTGAGIHQAFDEREDGVESPMKGLYQSLTYESGLSAGAWLLSSIIGNDWATISTLRDSIWYQAFSNPPLFPTNLGITLSNADLIASLSAKLKAGYDPTIVDIYGRLNGFSLFKGAEGGIQQTLSGVRKSDPYSNHQVPFPIMLTMEVTNPQRCMPELNATQYEFTPVEFGSWDKERAAFIPTEFTGSIVGSDGSQACVKGFDKLSYILGASGNILPESCNPLEAAGVSAFAYFFNYSESILAQAGHTQVLRDVYAPVPNPFQPQASPASSYPPKGTSAFSEIYMIDVGEAGQVAPIWPFLYRADVDVLFVGDANQDPSTNGYPDGSDLRLTYLQATWRGIARMPYIPDSVTFVQRGYTQRPTFFGCDEPDALTIIYLPNKEYVFPSNTSSFQITYTQAQVDGMLANGQAVATYNGQKDFAKCVGCAIMKKTGTSLPPGCDSCFAQYCAQKSQ